MSRKRPPEGDYICQVCLCPCDASGGKHVGGGGAGHTSCGKPATPVLRSVWEANLKADLAAIRDTLSRPIYRTPEES